MKKVNKSIINSCNTCGNSNDCELYSLAKRSESCPIWIKRDAYYLSIAYNSCVTCEKAALLDFVNRVVVCKGVPIRNQWDEMNSDCDDWVLRKLHLRRN